MSLTSPEDIQAWYDAVQLYEAGDIDPAIDKFHEVSLQNSRILYNLGCCFLRKNDIESAAESYKEAVENDQHLAVGFFMRGLTSFLLKEYDNALDCFKQSNVLLRGNRYLDYKQLGLKYQLFACEIYANQAVAAYYLDDVELAKDYLLQAVGCKAEKKHETIVDMLSFIQSGYPIDPFNPPQNVIFRPPSSYVKNLKKKNYLGKAKVLSTENTEDIYACFSGIKEQILNNNKLSLPKPKPLNRGNMLDEIRTPNRRTSLKKTKPPSSPLPFPKRLPPPKSTLPPAPQISENKNQEKQSEKRKPPNTPVPELNRSLKQKDLVNKETKVGTNHLENPINSRKKPPSSPLPYRKSFDEAGKIQKDVVYNETKVDTNHLENPINSRKKPPSSPLPYRKSFDEDGKSQKDVVNNETKVDTNHLENPINSRMKPPSSPLPYRKSFDEDGKSQKDVVYNETKVDTNSRMKPPSSPLPYRKSFDEDGKSVPQTNYEENYLQKPSSSSAIRSKPPNSPLPQSNNNKTLNKQKTFEIRPQEKTLGTRSRPPKTALPQITQKSFEQAEKSPPLLIRNQGKFRNKSPRNSDEEELDAIAAAIAAQRRFSQDTFSSVDSEHLANLNNSYLQSVHEEEQKDERAASATNKRKNKLPATLELEVQYSYIKKVKIPNGSSLEEIIEMIKSVKVPKEVDICFNDDIGRQHKLTTKNFQETLTDKRKTPKLYCFPKS